MHFWNNQSVVSKETFSWRCINFSDFSHFLERVFRSQFTKNWSKSHSWTCFLSLLMAGVQETFHHSHESFCHSSFWELSSEKVFQKGQNHWNQCIAENCFCGNKTQVISKGHWITSEAYFIKWTTSGEPPVCLKNPFCSYFGSNKH